MTTFYFLQHCLLKKAVAFFLTLLKKGFVALSTDRRLFL